MKEVPIKMQEGLAKMHNMNGWINMLNLGRYGTDYNTRAGVAYMGLGANMHEAPSIPPRTWTATVTRSTAPTSM